MGGVYLQQSTACYRPFSSRDPRLTERHFGVQLVHTWVRADMQRSLSTYAENLLNEAKRRYMEKIAAINSLDPFGGCPGEAIETIPAVDARDLVAYLVLQTNFNKLSKDSKFCLQVNPEGSLRLDPTHAYQTQLFVSDVQYCDFCVCTFNGDKTGIHIERIFKDEQFWNDFVIKAQTFF